MDRNGKDMSSSEEIIFRYWGKARSDEEKGPAYHLLPYHCLDVGMNRYCQRDLAKCQCDPHGCGDEPAQGVIECLGRSRNAKWNKTKN
jgi:hypothetical protein